MFPRFDFGIDRCVTNAARLAIIYNIPTVPNIGGHDNMLHQV